MKRLALCAVLLVSTFGLSLEGTAYKCVLTNDCKPLPCEFVAELKYAKASVRTFAKISAPDSTDPAAFERFISQVAADLRKASKAYSKCSGRALEDDVPLAGVTPPACVVGVRDANGKVQPKSLADLLKASSTCSEIVEAEYKRAEARQEHCQAEVNRARPTSVARRRADALQAAQERMDSLRESLLRYLSSCAPDAKLSRELSKLGLDDLMKEGKANRIDWLAQRARDLIAGLR